MTQPMIKPAVTESTTARLRILTPGHWHRRLSAMAVLADVLRPVLEPSHEPHQLLDRLLIRLPALFRGRQFGLAQDAGFRITARPRDHRRGTGGEQVHPVERAVLLVEADRAV